MKKYTITIEIELTQEHINLLKRCYKQKYLFFNRRNKDGTLYLIGDLLKYNLIDRDFDSWYLIYKLTYKLTDLGIKLLKENNLID